MYKHFINMVLHQIKGYYQRDRREQVLNDSQKAKATTVQTMLFSNYC